MLLSAVGVSWLVRSLWRESSGWQRRWNLGLGAFLFAPMLLLTSAIAVFWMGPRGRMVHRGEGWMTYGLSFGFLAAAVAIAIAISLEAWQTCRRLNQLPTAEAQGHTVRLLPHKTPFIAQIGLWQPQLVVSQGLLDTLDAEHLAVVLMHEQAHVHYRDTFWFFCLSGLKRLTDWLPQNQALWQELLVLRELRADRWAAQQVDGLLLAEALLAVVSVPYGETYSVACAAFDSEVMRDRLTERIDALLDNTEPMPQNNFFWLWFPLVLVPFLVVPFHVLQ
jgi:Zn-dependent protease with chaperone function